MKNKWFWFSVIAVVSVFCFDGEAWAQTLSLNVEDAPSGSATARIFNVIMMITVLSVAPSILVMMTSFTRLIVVFPLRAMPWRQTQRRQTWFWFLWRCF